MVSYRKDTTPFIPPLLRGNMLLFLILSVISSISLGQDYNHITYKEKEYFFEANFNDSTFIGSLTISMNKAKIYDTTFEYDKITAISGHDLEGNGKREYLIDYYTGGAHCCTMMMVGLIKNDKLSFTDSIFWGNSGYEVSDLDGDGTKEIVGTGDMFAYAFTNYAQSFEPIAIYKYNYGKLRFANADFENVVEKDIRELKESLKEYTDKGFECPASDSEDTFNTDAGAVKALLAPIVWDYASIDRADEGYALIDKVYKCMDKKKFGNILRNEFKIK